MVVFGELGSYLAGSHHHTSTDSIKRIRSDTSTSGNGPAEQEGSKEVTLKRTNKENGFDRVVHAEVETTVDNDSKDGRAETSNTIRGKSLLVDVDETVELAFTTLLGALGIVGKTSTGVIQGVDEEEGSGTSSLNM
jgi:hypothetical protein